MKKHPSFSELKNLCADFVALRQHELDQYAQSQCAVTDDCDLNVLANSECAHSHDKMTTFEKLMQLPGLENVKSTIARQISYQRIMMTRAKHGLRTPNRLMHMILTGNPGTGKTTIAKMLAKIYYEEGILLKDVFVETSRGNLVGRYIGMTEENTRERIEQAQGGVLFIDEAYSLTNDTGNDFGPRVIDTLMPVLSSPDSKMMVILAGYPNQMRDFLRTNPGLASRFPTIIDFPDYDIDTMMEIAEHHIAEIDMHFTPEARSRMRQLVEQAVLVPESGNARFVITAIDNHIIPSMCVRLLNNEISDIDKMSEITVFDIPAFAEIPSLNHTFKRSVGFSSNL